MSRVRIHALWGGGGGFLLRRLRFQGLKVYGSRGFGFHSVFAGARLRAYA